MPTDTPFIIDQTTFPPAKIASFATLLNIILPLLTIGAGLIFLVMLLYGAFTWLTAGDNMENVKKSQKILGFALAGLIIVIISFMAVKLLGIFFNVSDILPF